MNKIIKFIVPVVVLLASMILAWILVKNGPEVEQKPIEKRIPAVSVVEAVSKTARIPVHTRGTVIPGTEIQLSAEVAGKIISVPKNFKNGGFFNQGDVLYSVDPTPYELDTMKATSMVATAKLNFEKAQANVEANRSVTGLPQTNFALGIPQLEEARARYDAAKADLQLAGMQLKKASLTAPFRGRIRQKLVDVGKYVTPGMPVAVYYATATAEVRLPLTDEQQKLIEIPLQYEDNQQFSTPSPVYFTDTSGRYRWQGRLIRSEAGFDETNRLFYVVAEVDAPYQRDPDDPGKPPFAAGLFVEAEVEGRVHDGVIELPREVLHAGDVVWVVKESSRLQKRPVEVLHRGRETVFISSGLAPGEWVITTPLDVAVDGMEVDVLRSESQMLNQSSLASAPVRERVGDVKPLKPTEAKTVAVSPPKSKLKSNDQKPLKQPEIIKPPEAITSTPQALPEIDLSQIVAIAAKPLQESNR